MEVRVSRSWEWGRFLEPGSVRMGWTPSTSFRKDRVKENGVRKNFTHDNRGFSVFNQETPFFWGESNILSNTGRSSDDRYSSSCYNRDYNVKIKPRLIPFFFRVFRGSTLPPSLVPFSTSLYQHGSRDPHKTLVCILWMLLKMEVVKKLI